MALVMEHCWETMKAQTTETSLPEQKVKMREMHSDLQMVPTMEHYWEMTMEHCWETMKAWTMETNLAD